MFSFDITLIVQMVHFFLAWWFIDRFLFKKLVKEVQDEHSFTSGLQQKLDKETHVLAEMCQQKDAEWNRFKVLYKDQIPLKISPYVMSQDIRYQSPVEMTEDKKIAIIHDISQELIRQVSHD